MSTTKRKSRRDMHWNGKDIHTIGSVNKCIAIPKHCQLRLHFANFFLIGVLHSSIKHKHLQWENVWFDKRNERKVMSEWANRKENEMNVQRRELSKWKCSKTVAIRQCNSQFSCNKSKRNAKSNHVIYQQINQLIPHFRHKLLCYLERARTLSL